MDDKNLTAAKLKRKIFKWKLSRTYTDWYTN